MSFKSENVQQWKMDFFFLSCFRNGCRSAPVSTALCWSPHRLRGEKWWLCQWSSPPSACCRWLPPVWRQWSRCADQWECSLWLCSGPDEHSHTSLVGPKPTRAKEDSWQWKYNHRKLEYLWDERRTSTLVGQHSTALLSMILASSGSSSSTAVFHSRTDLDTFSRAAEGTNVHSEWNVRRSLC